MLDRSVTQQYPEVKPDLPARSRGVIALVEENCTVCMLCARECPDWCIYIDSHKETLPAPEGGRPRARNVLDRFAIDFSLCMYCGICVEVCPFDALFWSPEFEYAEYDIRDLLHEKDRLGEWRQTVPVPPALDPGAEPAKEIAAASRPSRARPAGRTGRTEEAAGKTAERKPEEKSGEAARGTRRPPGPARTRSAPSAAHAAVRAIRPPGSLPKRRNAAAERGPEPPSSTERDSGPAAGGEPGKTPPRDSGEPPDPPSDGADTKES
ncbi:NuoI/complex I 23 kDa subunit family protein [Thermostaphylospora chromogena]|nr:NADH-quinone oxidoreductase subunit I [Thermostaphylospora chromogena]